MSDPSIAHVHGRWPDRYVVRWWGYLAERGVGNNHVYTITLRGAQKVAQRVRDGYYAGIPVEVSRGR